MKYLGKSRWPYMIKINVGKGYGHINTSRGNDDISEGLVGAW